MNVQQFCSISLLFAAFPACSTLHAQDAASARSFLISIYSHYQKGSGGIEFDGPNAIRYFHSSLLALEKADVKANGPGYAPAIDSDPICGCQDWDGIWNLKIDIKIESPVRAKANVSFALFNPKDQPGDKPSKMEITLLRENGVWRIWDILDNSDPSFTSSVRTLLKKDLENLRKYPSPAPN